MHNHSYFLKFCIWSKSIKQHNKYSINNSAHVVFKSNRLSIARIAFKHFICQAWFWIHPSICFCKKYYLVRSKIWKNDWTPVLLPIDSSKLFFIILVWLLFVLFWSLLRKHLFRWTLFISDLYVKMLNYICIFRKFSQTNADYPKHIAEWVFINIFSMFAMISIANDVINLDEYFVTSSLSLIMILAFLVYLYRTKFEMFSLKFITEMEIEYQLIYENNLFKL